MSDKQLKILQNELKMLVEAFAISGYEWTLDIVKTIQQLAGSKGQRIGDNLVYCVGKGRKKIFISAHMDEVGFFITQSKPSYAQVVPIGDVDIKDCIGSKLVFDWNGKRIISNPLPKAKSFATLKIYGLGNIPKGTVGTFEKKSRMKDELVESPSLDNKLGCLILLELLKTIKEQKAKTFILCFSCREETTTSGLMIAIKQFEPDICIDIDSAYALPMRKNPNWQIPEIGKGPALQLMGSGFIMGADNRIRVENLAKRILIPLQYEIPDQTGGAGNSRTLLLNGSDVIQINVPAAFQHGPKSKASFNDIWQTKQLLETLLEEI